MKRLSCYLVMLWVAPTLTHAQVYKCSNKDSSVSYQARPCPTNTSTSRINVANKTASTAPSAQEVMRQLQSQVDVVDAEQQQRRAQAQQRQQQQQEREALAAHCAFSRQQIAVVQTARPVFRVDEKGERHYLEDNERASKIADMQQKMTQHCP